MIAASVDRAQIESKIADIIEAHLGVEKSVVLSGDSFLDIYPDFDSLTMFEILGMLDDHYGFSLEFGGPEQRIPSNVHQLADEVIVALEAKAAQQAASGIAEPPGASAT